MARKKRKAKTVSKGPVVPKLPDDLAPLVRLHLFNLISQFLGRVNEINTAVANRNAAALPQLVAFANVASSNLKTFERLNPSLELFIESFFFAAAQKQDLTPFLAEIGANA